jgi:hypothetical protein
MLECPDYRVQDKFELLRLDFHKRLEAVMIHSLQEHEEVLSVLGKVSEIPVYHG